MFADPTDGFIEVRIDDDNTIYTYTGRVNNDNAFDNLNLQSDGAGTFFSNIIISNAELTFDDNTSNDISIDYNVDCQRKTEIDLTLTNDVERIVANGIFVDYLIDTERLVYYGTSINYFADTERITCNALSVDIDVERIISIPVTLAFDLSRTIINVAIWRYENIGTIDDLLNAEECTQVTDSTLEKTWTGKAFYNHNHDAKTKMFDIPDTDRIWIKFDVYRPRTDNNFGIFSILSAVTGYGIGIYADVFIDGDVTAWDYNPESPEQSGVIVRDVLTANEIQTIVIHLQADAENGTFEVFTNDGGLVYSNYGKCNRGRNFTSLNFGSNSFSNLDSYFSNIVISNGKLDFDDNVSLPVTFYTDMERRTEKESIFICDTERVLLRDSINVVYTVDAVRLIDISEILLFDYERVISHDFPLNILIYMDTERDVTAEFVLSIDAQRCLSALMNIDVDTQRQIGIIVALIVDTMRYLPYQLVVDGTETTVIPMAPNDAGLQSINILISEQQVTDRVSFVHAGNCNIMDKIQGTYRDYEFDLRIEETDRQGILQTCSCCSDIDELLYSQIAYTIPENKYEWSEDYLDMLGVKQQENPEEEIEAQPTTTVEEHLRMIAEKMGKNLVYRGPKFYSTNNVSENGGKTYASVISELIGWSSRLPQMEINAYFRGNKLYVIMRGFESNTISLDGAKIANLRVNQKLIRTTWGSDVKSESVVDTFINDWQELELEPYTPEAGGGSTSTYSDDNLVETTTVESNSEKTETTYYYNVDANGAKYLAYEETTKYELDDRGNWQEYDTIVTTHDRVSMTQSHIYAENSDGGIVGEVVSPNRFDDRATPYDKGHGGGGRGFVLMHDSQGNQYKCYSIKYYSEEMEKGTRTTYGLSLVDTSFPVYGEANLIYLTQQLMWLNRKTEETISMDIYDVNHVIGFNDKISYNGAIYYLKSNNVLQDEHIINKQSIVMVRWI